MLGLHFISGAEKLNGIKRHNKCCVSCALCVVYVCVRVCVCVCACV